MRKLYKRLILIFIILLVIAGIGALIYTFLPDYNQLIYDRGVNDGVSFVANQQSQTGEIYIIGDGVVQIVSINQICESLR